MADLRVAQRAYALQPVRSRAVRVARSVLAFVIAAALGAGALHLYASAHATYADASPGACVTAAPVARDALQADLERAQLALAQESASRTAVQKSADAAATEVARLNGELQFLRGQALAQSPRTRR
ncbi:hypothetical protein [Paraburkholderia sp.]|uniref:hypothetical protein n=1 Tax=Paraburkholderia sp. TaxID=1926495 RepID=UPI0023A3762E|nr:hypothetical protein [Paraburkholderia sp.]MDE1182280.1 hypothetical protein [Paraburkholderia sp.]